MQAAQDINAKVEGFLAKTGMAPSSFGLASVKSGNLVAGLRNGRRLRPVTAAKVDEFIRASEAEHQRKLRYALAAIKDGDGYVQVNMADEPLNLPKWMDYVTFKQLIASGQLAPSGDSFLGGKPQTYRPI